MENEINMIGKKLVTTWMILLWVLLLPIIAFIPQSNCWYYAGKRWFLGGFRGKIVPVASRRWRGYHCVYEDEHGQLWEFTLHRMPKFVPWWKLILYRGIERKYRGKL